VQNGIDAQRTKSEATARLRAQAEAKLRLEALTKARIAAQAQAKAQAIGGRSVFEERKRRLAATQAARELRNRAHDERVAAITGTPVDQLARKRGAPRKPLHHVQSRLGDTKAKLGTPK
jgi:hypothetical protein